MAEGHSPTTPGPEVLPGTEAPTPPTGWVLYVDLDAYYVSCELRTRPELVGRPVIVGPPPSEGPSRGVVLSASYEARKFGVRSALPAAAAARMCPEAVWIPPDFPKYESTAREVRRLLARHATKLVPYSIDEAAVLVDARSATEARTRALRVQEELRSELGLPSSIGVAPWRVVAKIASDRAKPGGVVVVPPEGVASFLAPLPVRSVPGVGPKTEALLKSHGVVTVGDLANRRSSEFVRTLGHFAPELIRLARGNPVEAPEDESGPRSRSSDHTFPRDVEEWPEVERAVRELVDGLARSLDEEGLRYGTVGVQFRWADFSRSQRSRALPAAREGAAPMRATADRLARELWEVEGAGGRRSVRTVSVRTERLVPKTQRQAVLTEYPATSPDIK
jgi:nucleotidyltransferase/DNA polymerase involved in DNA repair